MILRSIYYIPIRAFASETKSPESTNGTSLQMNEMGSPSGINNVKLETFDKSRIVTNNVGVAGNDVNRISVDVNLNSASVPGTMYSNPMKMENRVNFNSIFDEHSANASRNYNSFSRYMIRGFTDRLVAFNPFSSNVYDALFNRIAPAYGIMSAGNKLNVRQHNTKLFNIFDSLFYKCANEATLFGNVMTLDKMIIADANEGSKFDNTHRLTMQNCDVSVFRQVDLQTNQAVVSNKGNALLMGRAALLPIQQPVHLHIGRKELMLLRMMSMHYKVITADRFCMNQGLYNFLYETCSVYNLDYNHCNFSFSLMFTHMPVEMVTMSRTIAEHAGLTLVDCEGKHFINACLLNNIESLYDREVKSSIWSSYPNSLEVSDGLRLSIKNSFSVYSMFQGLGEVDNSCYTTPSEGRNLIYLMVTYFGEYRPILFTPFMRSHKTSFRMKSMHDLYTIEEINGIDLGTTDGPCPLFDDVVNVKKGTKIEPDNIPRIFYCVRPLKFVRPTNNKY